MFSARRGPRGGFTLIEILIVISIIAILASLATGGVLIARKRAAEAKVKTTVNEIHMAVERFRSEEGYYPGAEYSDLDENAFAAVYEALLGEPRSKGGKGGRSSPYLDGIPEKDVVVLDELSGKYRQATLDERLNPEIEKFIVDEWGEPLWYRENKSKRVDERMHNRHKFDVWSTGPDRENQTLLMEKGDDIGNW